MNRIFLCDSPFQLFSATSIIDKEKTIDADMIFLLCLFDGWEKYADVLKQEGFNYLVINRSRNRFLTVLKFWTICRKYKNKVQGSTKLFVTSQNGYAVIFCNMLSRNNNEICFFDEGLYTYVCNLKDNPFSEYYDNHRFFRWLYGKNKLNFEGEVYAFEPKLISDSYKKNKITYSRIMAEKLLISPPNITIMYYKAIIFDAYFLERGNEYFRYEKILEIIKENTKDNICIKKHPRKDYIKNNTDLFNTIDNSNVWEIECTKIVTPGKVLITSYSSAVFTPALLGIRNYTIILLYKLIMDTTRSSLSEDLNCFIDRFGKYIPDVKVIVPTSVEEVIQGMEMINGDEY